jgi:hypothetical protein
MKAKNRKGQEEMIGFVLIVVIITIAVLVLLIFSMRRPSGMEASQEVENFIQASTYFTTDCEIASESLSLKKLIVACQNNERCSNDKEACESLKFNINNLIESSFESGGYYQGYELKVYMKSREENETSMIIDAKTGNLTGSWQAGDVLFPVPPNDFHVYLKVYSQA